MGDHQADDQQGKYLGHRDRPRYSHFTRCFEQQP
jgi:hypothetical protein